MQTKNVRRKTQVYIAKIKACLYSSSLFDESWAKQPI